MADLFVISAPSGAGKTSLVSALLKTLDNIELSISHTTRAKRPKEKDGVDYHFVSPAQFNKLIAENALLEYAKVFGHYYGTHKNTISTILNKNSDVILEIDWQGYHQVKQNFDNVISIFILPPSLNALKQRLTERAQDDSHTIENRMVKAHNEIKHYDEYDFLIINRDFDSALTDIKSILLNQRLTLKNQRRKQQVLLDKLLENR